MTDDEGEEWKGKSPKPTEDDIPRIGRPPLDVNTEVVEGMAIVGATNTEIAEFCGCSVDTLTRRFADILVKSRAGRKAKLRRAQYQVALKGNPAMLIWLGKNELGQSDKVEVDAKSAAETARAIREALAAIDAGVPDAA